MYVWWDVSPLLKTFVERFIGLCWREVDYRSNVCATFNSHAPKLIEHFLRSREFPICINSKCT